MLCVPSLVLYSMMSKVSQTLRFCETRLNQGLIMTDDFAVPGAPDAFGLPPSPWNYPAPGKK